MRSAKRLRAASRMCGSRRASSSRKVRAFEHEDAAVPEIVAVREVGFRGRAVGLLGRRLDGVGAAVEARRGGALPDVAVAGVRLGRLDAEQYEFACLRDLRRRGARPRRSFASSFTTWSDGMTARMALGLSRSASERGDGDGRCGIAGDRLQHDGARCDTGAIELPPSPGSGDRCCRAGSAGESPLRWLRRVSVAARKLELWPLKKRMNCFGYIARDSGHSRVPEPPERMTGIDVAHGFRANSERYDRRSMSEA